MIYIPNALKLVALGLVIGAVVGLIADLGHLAH